MPIENVWFPGGDLCRILNCSLYIQIIYLITYWLLITVCRNKESKRYTCWITFSGTFEGWKKTLIYAQMSTIPLIWPHALYLSYVAATQLILLAFFHFVLAVHKLFEQRRLRLRRCRHKDKLMHSGGDCDSFDR